MPKPKQPTRGQQPSTLGLGLLFASPTKRRNKKKTTTIVRPLGEPERRRELEKRLLELQKPRQAPILNEPDAADVQMEDTADPFTPDISEADVVAAEVLDLVNIQPFDESPRRPRRVLPNKAANSLYNRWALVLPRLIEPSLSYVDQSTGTIPARVTSLATTCTRPQCPRKTTQVLCLFQDCKSP